ncbi:hypothetical protein Tco_0581898, partial [Tanacetum coccineum]
AVRITMLIADIEDDIMDPVMQYTTLPSHSEHPSDTYVLTMKMEILLEPASNKLLVGYKKMEMVVEVKNVEKNDTMAPNADDAINKELVNLIRLDKFNVVMVGIACLSSMVSVAAVWWNFHVLKSHRKVMLQVKMGGNLLLGCLYRSFVVIRDCLGVLWSSSLFVDYIADMKCLEEHGRDLILIGPSVIIMWLGSFLKINGSVEQEYNFEDIASDLMLPVVISYVNAAIDTTAIGFKRRTNIDVHLSYAFGSDLLLAHTNHTRKLLDLYVSPSDKEVYTSVLIKRFTHPVNIPKPPQNVVSSSSALANSPAFVHPSRTPTSTRLGSALNIETLVAAAEHRETLIDETIKGLGPGCIFTLTAIVKWECSSYGRALALHARGTGYLHGYGVCRQHGYAVLGIGQTRFLVKSWRRYAVSL